MNFSKPAFAQNGVALALSLLLLLVLTIIGVAAMNTTIMQERMSGNIQTQTQSFETSSEGVGRSLEYFHQELEPIVDAGHGDSNDIICGRVHGFDEDPPDDDRVAWIWPDTGGFDEIYDEDLRLEQQMYCCRSWAQIPTESGEAWVENPSKLFVLSRGSMITTDDSGVEAPLAQREIEVRLDEADPGKPTCAFCVPGEVESVAAGDSNALRMHGACGPAITTEDQDGAGKFNEAISENRKDNYDGGITHGDMGPPWNDPVALAEFAFWIKLGLAEADPGADPDESYHGYWSGDVTLSGNKEFGIQPSGGDEWGRPEITYIDGNADFGGNISGHGIMIVRGTLEWGGTPDFEGLLVALGGGFTVDGGGGGGNPRGSLVTTHLEDLISGPGPLDDPDLLVREELRYPVSEVAGEVEMFPADTAEAHRRPVLIDNTGSRILPVVDNRGMLNGFEHENGNSITHAAVGNDIRLVFNDADGNSVTTWLRYIGDDSKRPRDKFGRLLPDFVWSPLVNLDTTTMTWPPDEYGYDPNQWAWDPDPANPPFSYGSSTFDWGGGGNQAFTYDCRWLQRLRQALLCEEPAVNWTTGFPPGDYDFEDPDDSLVCNHHQAGFEYNPDLEPDDYPNPDSYGTSGALLNQYAWHLWVPRCDCLGITRDADMIISGWRENLGWRDDEFAQCQGLPAPDGT